MIRRILVLIFIVCLLFFNCGPERDNFEPNDNPEFAKELRFAKFMKIIFDKENDIDFFYFSIDKPGYIFLTTSIEKPVDANCIYDIYDNEQNIIYSNILLGKKCSLPAGKFFIGIKEESGKKFLKSFRIKTVYEKVELDEFEPNDELQQARIIYLKKKNKINIFPINDKEFFKFMLPDTGTVKFELSIEKPINLNLIMNLYDNDGNKILTNVKLPTKLGLGEGNYIVSINDEKDTSSDIFFYFSLDLKRHRGDEYEPNDSIEYSKVIELDKRYNINFYPIKDMDYFKFALDKKTVISFFLYNMPSNITPVIDIYDTTGNKIIEAANIPDNFELVAGIYTICLYDREEMNFSEKEFGFKIRAQ